MSEPGELVRSEFSAQSESLEATRAQLRRYLLPASADTEQDPGDHFPRSKVMRFAFNPRNRKILVLSGSILGTIASQLVGANRLGMVAEVVRAFSRKKS